LQNGTEHIEATRQKVRKKSLALQSTVSTVDNTKDKSTKLKPFNIVNVRIRHTSLLFIKFSRWYFILDPLLTFPVKSTQMSVYNVSR